MVTAREFTLALVFVFRLWVDSYSFRCRTSGFFATNASKYDLGTGGGIVGGGLYHSIPLRQLS